MIDITIDAAEILRDLALARPAVQLAAQAATYAGAAAVMDDAKATTLFNDQTGRLRGSIRTRRAAEGGLDVVAGNDGKIVYASFMETGTAPHIISGKNGGMLRFQINGQWVQKRSVNHPGTKPRPFMALAALKGAEVAGAAMEFRLAGALRDLSR